MVDLTDAELKEHTLNRLGLGTGPVAAARYDELGFDGYVNEQIELAKIPANQASGFVQEARPPGGLTGANGTEVQHRTWEFYQRAHIYRALVTERRLLDVLTDFWWNHFNVAVGSTNEAATDHGWTTQLPGIAERSLGRFEDLVSFAAMSHSMQSYLDNIFNSVEEPNENLGREILELHTMGVDGGYTQDDVVSASRILTGWYAAGFNAQNGTPGTLRYNQALHDTDEKIFLGETFPAGADGRTEQERFLQIISNHPETYKRISYKLCQKFVADEPPAFLVFEGAVVMSETNGNLEALLRHILFSEEFKMRRNFRGKRKRPRHFATSTGLALGRSLRQVDDRSSSVIAIPGIFVTYRLKPEAPMLKFVLDADEQLFYYSQPTGYPNVGSYWISAMTLLRRFEYASYAAENWTDTLQIDNALGTDAMIAALESAMLPGGLTEKSRSEAVGQINAAAPGDRVQAGAQIIMLSPEFLRF